MPRAAQRRVFRRVLFAPVPRAKRPAARAPQRPSPCLPQVLTELASDKSLERFRIEYEKLYRTLKKSHGAFCLMADAGDFWGRGAAARAGRLLGGASVSTAASH